MPADKPEQPDKSLDPRRLDPSERRDWRDHLSWRDRQNVPADDYLDDDDDDDWDDQASAQTKPLIDSGTVVETPSSEAAAAARALRESSKRESSKRDSGKRDLGSGDAGFDGAGFADVGGIAEGVAAAEAIDPLVLYLDGQLETHQRKEIEQRLLTDESARQHLAQLQQAWDVLDVLPRPTCGQSFTESTVKLVVQRELKQQQKVKSWGARPLQKILRLFAAVAAVAASLTLGFAGTRYFQRAEDREFLQSYPLIDNWEKYDAAGDFDFLLRLEKEALFNQELNKDAP